MPFRGKIGGLVLLWLVAWATFGQAPGQPAAIGSADPAAKINISLVRFIIDDSVYNWRDPAAMPEREANGLSHPAMVASFLDFRPGDQLAEADLRRRAGAAEARLAGSGCFYAPSVLVLPSNRDPQARLVVISLREGFRWRFGGGNAFGLVGLDNFGGLRRSWRLYAGANLAGAEYADGLLFGLPLEAAGSALYSNSLLGGLLPFHRFEAEASLAWRPHPDWRLGINLDARYMDLLPDQPAAAWFPAGSWLSPGLAATLAARFRFPGQAFSLNLAGNGSAGLSLAAWPVAAELDWLAAVQAQASGRLAAIVGNEFFALALQASAGWSAGSLPLNRRFDLASTADAAVRSALSFSQASPDRFLLANIELRGPALRFFIPPFFNTYLKLFLFADLALAERQTLDPAALPEALRLNAAPETAGAYFLEAFGGGLRFGFDAPVNTHFTLHAGVNRSGVWGIGLVGSGGFD
ncbi:MAG: hypothetical protein A2087_14680 [Spirochaetes bacterium GWD1_61_31]|nr:MAG: hypothetical protein A2Y37_09350 [Spirochaetes bacterium GWB1_60_80]OHD29178.1 MAG: hypothetical protein A2004_05700 [Spirochaetes bacterium GWC1_61_12]OHD35021.1 MAG: hypothetical protein A2087_14680 [Spirochaetes bacterium GWD1_61_31]OHD44031.1 MAG: hypothetical protein A2Y35_01700 [Spirochaetes bacterium GWE1_60_18]OHD59066.1 MAG: hypothetical protein A2Y32_02420 [Spirochaetes bacterium GWF1_60_12]HAP42597.1 hypothetical protein [Spirochaetaceae bacterium]